MQISPDFQIDLEENHKTTPLDESHTDPSLSIDEWKEVGKDFLKSAAIPGYATASSLLNYEIPKSESELHRDLATLPLNTTPDKKYKQTLELDQSLSSYESQLGQDTFEITNKTVSTSCAGVLGDLGGGILQYLGLADQISEGFGANLLDFIDGSTTLGVTIARGAYGAALRHQTYKNRHRRTINKEKVSRQLLDHQKRLEKVLKTQRTSDKDKYQSNIL